MNSELESKVELTQMLHRFVQTVRCSKKRPQLAAEAARREMEFKEELNRLELERARTEQAELVMHPRAA